MTQMKAVTIYQAGGPEVLKIEQRPIPQPKPGWVLIQVKSFGLNRSELFTRQGHSPNVAFPRILGIEATGVVAASPDGVFDEGETVVTAMGGMGRMFDGGYAEYTAVPNAQVRRVKTSLDWDVLGALPEMLQTAFGALTMALKAQAGERILLRGGTTSVGLCAAILAKDMGLEVIATTRIEARRQSLLDNGADEVIIETGAIADEIRRLYPNGVDKVLELVGATTLLDSLAATAPGGSVCMAGMVGNAWELPNFSPMGAIPSTVNLTTYSGGVKEFMATPLQQIIDKVEAGHFKPPIGQVFHIDNIVAAHRAMEDNTAGGKIVVLT